jgi:hypothetical protein
MKLIASMFVGMMALLSVPAQGAQDTIVTFEKIRIRRVQGGGAYGKNQGTTVTLKIDHKTKQLVGIDSEDSSVRIVDSAGKDLTVEGRKVQKKAIELGNYPIVARDSMTHDCVSRPHLRTRKGDKGMTFECHATAVPSSEATGVSLKGTLALLVRSSKEASEIVPFSSIIGGKAIRLGVADLVLVGSGGGMTPRGSFTDMQCKTTVTIDSVSVVGREREKGLVDLVPGSPNQTASLRVFSEKLKPDDKVKITYSVPERITIPVDLTIGMGSAE